MRIARALEDLDGQPDQLWNCLHADFSLDEKILLQEKNKHPMSKLQLVWVLSLFYTNFSLTLFLPLPLTWYYRSQ